MMTDAEMRKQIDGLTSEMIGHLYDAFHDLKGGPLHRIVLDILWDRHATRSEPRPPTWSRRYPYLPQLLSHQWPRHERFVTRAVATEWSDAIEFSYWVVGYCAAGKPGAPLHRVKRKLDWSYRTELGGKPIWRRFQGFECECGRRTDHPDLQHRLNMNFAREDPNSRVWPTTVINEIIHYRVCKFAKGIDDVCHAPIADDTMCLCGGYLAANNQDGKSDQLLPSH